MHDFGFDKLVDRRGTSSLKWDFYPNDVLPMWVADMDFQSPQAVIDALIERSRHGVFGYTRTPESLVETIRNRLQSLYNWHTEPEWFIWLPGLVPAINLACRAFSAPDQPVVTPTPIYPPFLGSPKKQGRALQTVELREDDGTWLFPLDRLRQASQQSRLLLFCNPQNPTGKVFRRDELLSIANVCKEQDLIICSDEIHCDLLLSEVKHIPMASLSPDIADRTITLMAPSKTFNLPGLCCSFVVISNPELRRQFKREAAGLYSELNCMGLAGCEAAFRYGGDWLEALLAYLRGNLAMLRGFVEAELPGVTMIPPEATYLAWLDIGQLGLEDVESRLAAARLGLSPGRYFGTTNDYLRLNFACPRSLLEEGLCRLKLALKP